MSLSESLHSFHLENEKNGVLIHSFGQVGLSYRTIRDSMHT